jgi:tetratricopeptide (TPR) repeat protein
MKEFLILLLTSLTLQVFSQTNEEKALEIGRKAIQEMEAGNIKESIKLLEQAKKLAPDDINYPYEIAYAHYLDKNYAQVIKINKGLLSHKQVNERIYQMLGNAYDLNGQPEKAIETYEAGIKVFPNSGSLYLERGNMEMISEKYGEALNYYENGIKVDPGFASNYYWASKIYLGSTEEVWGMIYGEIFMNMERTTKRCADISKSLYNTYLSEIQFPSDSTMSVSFSKNATITLESLKDPNNFKLPYGIGAYEPTLMIALLGERELNLDALDLVRTRFLNSYFDNKNHEKYPNILFDYQRKIQENGHLEAYNHWLLLKGDEEAFTKWQSENQEKWDDFVGWFMKNPLVIDENNNFHSSQY